MALSQPKDPALKRFTFFVSRRLEDGRERFRLHMGHFDTLEEAEEWVSVVREFYPGAWAGEAPGKRLRARAEPAAAVPAARAAVPAPSIVASVPRAEVSAPRLAALAPAAAHTSAPAAPAAQAATFAPRAATAAPLAAARA
ncbi:MAG: hypothetical protein ACRETB_11360, partial [Steroidobacteraceae bacterium]